MPLTKLVCARTPPQQAFSSETSQPSCSLIHSLYRPSYSCKWTCYPFLQIQFRTKPTTVFEGNSRNQKIVMEVEALVKVVFFSVQTWGFLYFSILFGGKFWIIEKGRYNRVGKRGFDWKICLGTTQSNSSKLYLMRPFSTVTLSPQKFNFFLPVQSTCIFFYI